MRPRRAVGPHLYAEHAPAAADCLHHQPEIAEMPPMSVAWPNLDTVLTQVISGDGALPDGSPWNTFGRVLNGYRAWKVGERDQARKLAHDTPGPLGSALTAWYEHLTPAALTSKDPS